MEIHNGDDTSTPHNNESYLSAKDATSGVDTRCHYGSLTGGFGIFVQFLLALLAFSCLIVKRFCEPKDQRRTWIVWFYDTSKQGFGAGVIHVANIFISQSAADPCIWYVMNFLLDSTVGIVFIFICLRLVALFVRCCNVKELRNGEYGEPPKLHRWLLQCVVYIFVMLAEKGTIVGLMTFSIWEKISKVIISPFRNTEQLEIVMVMFVIPVIVNGIIFWVVDNFLMKNMVKLPRLRSRSASAQYSKLKTEEDSYENECPREIKPE